MAFYVTIMIAKWWSIWLSCKFYTITLIVELKCNIDASTLQGDGITRPAGRSSFPSPSSGHRDTLETQTSPKEPRSHDVGNRGLPIRTRYHQIGRASCRERV